MDNMEGRTTVERMMMQNASMQRIPINGSIELLPLCNMNCKMCYVRLSKDEMNRQGRMRSGKEWLSLGEKMQKAGVLFLLLTGGEPLLHPDFKEIFVGLKKMGMILTINTNGTLIDENWVQFFEKYKPRRINITLYGTSEKVYGELCQYPQGFNKVINAIKMLKENDIDVKISGSIAKSNYEDVEKIIAMGEELGVPAFCDTYMMPQNRERSMPFDMQSRLDPICAAKARVKALKLEMKEDIFKEYARTKLLEIANAPDKEEIPSCMTCNAGKCSFTINWQGEMRPCVMLTSPAKNVFEEDFNVSWKYIYTTCDKILLANKCSACKKRKLCRTCAASALLEEGSYEAVPKYMCAYTDETIRLLKEELQDEEVF